MTTTTELFKLADHIGQLLKAQKATISVAESSTGGLLSAALLSVPGASAYYLGGAVVYTRRARRLLMGLEDADMTGIRSSSEPYALLLARTSRARFATTWAISETGAAGPSGNSYGDPAGHTCLAVTGERERVITVRTGSADRAANMFVFATASLELLRETLESYQTSVATR